jgi:hypothetical protein
MRAKSGTYLAELPSMTSRTLFLNLKQMHRPLAALLLILILIAPVSSSFAQLKLLNADQLEGLEQTAKNLVQDTKIKDEIIIALGQSPAVIAAYLDVSGLAKVWNIPLSKFKTYSTVKRHYIENGVVHNFEPLSKELELKLFEMFRRFLPTNELRSGRPVSLLDYGFSGRAVLCAADYLEKYLKAQRLNNSVHVRIMTNGRSSGQEILNHARIWNLQASVVETDPRIGSLFYERSLDQISEYGSFALTEGASIPPKVSRPIYRSLKNTIKTYLAGQIPRVERATVEKRERFLFSDAPGELHLTEKRSVIVIKNLANFNYFKRHLVKLNDGTLATLVWAPVFDKVESVENLSRLQLRLNTLNRFRSLGLPTVPVIEVGSYYVLSAWSGFEFQEFSNVIKEWQSSGAHLEDPRIIKLGTFFDRARNAGVDLAHLEAESIVWSEALGEWRFNISPPRPIYGRSLTDEFFKRIGRPRPELCHGLLLSN